MNVAIQFRAFELDAGDNELSQAQRDARRDLRELVQETQTNFNSVESPAL